MRENDVDEDQTSWARGMACSGAMDSATSAMAGHGISLKSVSKQMSPGPRDEYWLQGGMGWWVSGEMSELIEDLYCSLLAGQPTTD